MSASARERERERVVCAGIFVSLEKNGQLRVSRLKSRSVSQLTVHRSSSNKPIDARTKKKKKKEKERKGTDRDENGREADQTRKGGNPSRRRSPTNHTYHKISFSRSCGSISLI